MNVIVPLAGPDLVVSGATFKPFVKFSGSLLLAETLQKRPWYSRDCTYVFVCNRNLVHEAFVNEMVRFFPHSKWVFLSDFADGALLSALAGSALIRDESSPVVIDLMDIAFENDGFDVDEVFSDSIVGGILPLFESDHSGFSYATVNSGRVEYVAEKQVISGWASAGVYIYRNFPTFLGALAYTLSNRVEWGYKGCFFVAPSMNGVRKLGLEIVPWYVKNVRDYSTPLKNLR